MAKIGKRIRATKLETLCEGIGENRLGEIFLKSDAVPQLDAKQEEILSSATKKKWTQELAVTRRNERLIRIRKEEPDGN